MPERGVIGILHRVNSTMESSEWMATRGGNPMGQRCKMPASDWGDLRKEFICKITFWGLSSPLFVWDVEIRSAEIHTDAHSSRSVSCGCTCRERGGGLAQRGGGAKLHLTVQTGKHTFNFIFVQVNLSENTKVASAKVTKGQVRRRERLHNIFMHVSYCCLCACSLQLVRFFLPSALLLCLPRALLNLLFVCTDLMNAKRSRNQESVRSDTWLYASVEGIAGQCQLLGPVYRNQPQNEQPLKIPHAQVKRW